MEIEKINEAIAVIKKALLLGDSVVAYSGGKDSDAVLHLVRSINPRISAFFNNTGVEYSETVKHCREDISNLIEVKPEANFWKIMEKHGWQLRKGYNKKGKQWTPCCYYLKEKPAMKYYHEHNINVVFTGITRHESNNRDVIARKYGNLYWVKKHKVWKCHPILQWTAEEVWEYLRDNNIVVNEAYEKYGIERVGCQPCTAFIGWKKKLAKTNPKLLALVLKKQHQEQLPGFEPCGGWHDDTMPRNSLRGEDKPERGRALGPNLGSELGES